MRTRPAVTAGDADSVVVHRRTTASRLVPQIANGTIGTTSTATRISKSRRSLRTSALSFVVGSSRGLTSPGQNLAF